MKKIIIGIITLLVVAGVSYYFLSDKLNLSGESVTEHAKKHADPNYVCPMHPQIVKGEPGSCPICGMDLVKKEPIQQKETVVEHAKKHADPNYVCPMHPQIVKGEPGSCPICGMDLVKTELTQSSQSATTDSDKQDMPSIQIKANTAQNMGVRVDKAVTTRFHRTINTVGSVAYNEDSLLHVHPRASGWVEKLYIRAEGDHVSRGEVLLDLYSPDIVAAQKDLVVAKKSGKLFTQKGSTSLIDSAKSRLRLLGVPDSVINRVHSSGKSENRIPIQSLQSGVIISMGIRDGMYVTPSTEMYVVADLSTVWVLVDVFEHQYSWFKVGNKAEIAVSGLPGHSWKGKVDYIYPELNKVTRTLKVRLKFNNPEQRLKPNMFADVKIFSSDKDVLAVPSEAVIYHEDGPRIIKVTGKHEYKPVAIKIGMKSGSKVEILEGLEENDKVVVSGQFMLDSESNLQASFRRLSE